MENKNYDVIVIGAGPGGYVAAIRCAQLGLNTVCIDEHNIESGRPSPGGTCLNVGCIPSKSLLESSHYYSKIKNDSAQHGINASEVSISISKMMDRKNKIIASLTKGILNLLKKNKVNFIQGHGKIKSKNGDKYLVEISSAIGQNQSTILAMTTSIIIATGSKPATISSVAVDHQHIVDSTGALKFEQAPRNLGIIGAGVIGLELGSVWNRLGSKVSVFEASPTLLPAVDQQIAKMVLKTFTNQGLDLQLGQKITGTGCNQQEVIITHENETGKQQTTVDKLIVAVGRVANTDGLTTEAYQLTLDQQGFIEVNEQCQTNLSNVYAIGDVIQGPMLAHKASEEGVAVAEFIVEKNKAKLATHINHHLVPWVIYTWPEIAWVGQNEQQLKENGISYKMGTFPFAANSRAHTMGEKTGMVKILVDSDNDTILGVHIFAPHASELIAEAVLAMAFDGSSQDLAETIHAHPSLSEALHEAALNLHNKAIHI